MSLQHILRLGDPKLYETSVPVEKEEMESLKPSIEMMHNALMEFREKYGAGRAVAAPQIGVLKRFIYFNVGEPVVLFNPELFDMSEEKMEVWDDCLCFPGLHVKVLRSKSLKIKFRDMDWKEQVWELEGDLAELFQHEYDHLDGILATQRAIDEKSFRMLDARF